MTRVVIQRMGNGDTNWFADGPVELLIIDESIPRDRVYAPSAESFVVSTARIDELIGESRIGRLGDMPVAEAAVAAFLDGKAPPAPRRPTLVPKSRDEA